MDLHKSILFAVLLSALSCVSESTSCPQACNCSNICPYEDASICFSNALKKNFWIHTSCEYLTENAIYLTRSLSIAQKITDPHMLCNIDTNSGLLALSARLYLQPKDLNSNCRNSSQISHLDLSDGNLSRYPYEHLDFPQLKSLNLSSNAMGIHKVLNLNASSLHTLDLSYNTISSLLIGGSLSQLKILYLNHNKLHSSPLLHDFHMLTVLDLSFNEISFGSDLIHHKCKDLLPSRLETLLLRGNNIKFFPRRNCRILDAVAQLKTLDLGENFLSSVPGKYISDATMASIETLLLDRNQIYFIPTTAFRKFQRLKHLSLSKNYLKSLSEQVLHTLNQNFIVSLRSGSLKILVEDNPFICDCDLKLSLQNYASISHLSIEAENINCSSPANFKGQMLHNLAQSDLKCPYMKYSGEKISNTCVENTDCIVTCTISHGEVFWITPSQKVFNAETLLNDAALNSSYVLDESGHNLVILDIPLALTGDYRCVANSSFSSTTIEIEISIIPSPIGSIVAIAVSSVSFALAIAINCFNMCKCYCEALGLEEEPENVENAAQSPLKPSKQLGLHESEASLNANKKYDFACQHVFLDAVLKGAHTVKQTLYDARNSEFSNNVWEYASHLRDRLHIEMPSSVHIPRVSMPSISLPTISMPNISMPSMPNLQSFNTNIERLGTSVISRSHNLASSVGSVFTMRWLKYGGSDNDSDSDSEQVSIAQVQAYVHQDERREGSDAFGSLDTVSLPHNDEEDAVVRPLLTQPLLSATEPLFVIPISQSISPEEEEVSSNSPDVATLYQFETTV